MHPQIYNNIFTDFILLFSYRSLKFFHDIFLNRLSLLQQMTKCLINSKSFKSIKYVAKSICTECRASEIPTQLISLLDIMYTR